METPLYTTKEAAAYLRVCRTSIYNYVKAGLLKKHVSETGTVRYLKTDLDSLFKAVNIGTL